ncbi:MAG TPA: endonuclease/exonuclease/phosphatase family protein, partial [Thermomicrobiales bacterium]|nr:endonuclease/exonuclease/phosphatase family protein [Thermomicrobiales bacterium]
MRGLVMVLRVMSYNIQDGGRLRLSLIATIIRRQQPDVVALLEATNRLAVAALARGLGMRLVFGPANNPFHVAWLSKLPIQRSANHRLPGLAKTLLEIEVGWAGRPLQLFATHLAAGDDRLHPAEEAPRIIERIRAVAPGPHLLVGDFNALH